MRMGMVLGVMGVINRMLMRNQVVTDEHHQGTEHHKNGRR